MQNNTPSLGTENQSPYQIDSKREIVSLLRGLRDHNQLISMMINNGAEVFITSILDVDEQTNQVIIDTTPTQTANQRILEAGRVSFDGLLDKISIQFSTSGLESTSFENRPAFVFDLPLSLIRLQRREYYRINTPVSNPIRIQIPVEIDDRVEILKLPLVDVSCGGIAILDERKTLDCTTGTNYPQCKLDLPGVGIVDLTLQIRNHQDLVLLNGKSSRRLGCQFHNLSNSVLTHIQRYIMKLERERNARLTGIR